MQGYETLWLPGTDHASIATEVKIVEKMKADHHITYYAVPDRGHCDLTPEMRQKYNEAIIFSILGEIKI